jgi:hypothetical protein
MQNQTNADATFFAEEFLSVATTRTLDDDFESQFNRWMVRQRRDKLVELCSTASTPMCIMILITATKCRVVHKIAKDKVCVP